MIKKGSWVQIQKNILASEDRPDTLPKETKAVPLKLWVKGFLLEDCELNSLATIKTRSGRIENGLLVKENPAYLHTYGDFIPELLEIDRIVRQELWGDDYE